MQQTLRNVYHIFLLKIEGSFYSENHISPTNSKISWRDETEMFTSETIPYLFIFLSVTFSVAETGGKCNLQVFFVKTFP